MINKMNDNPGSNKDKPKNKINPVTGVLGAVLALGTAVGIVQVGKNNMDKVPDNISDPTTLVSEQFIPGKINLDTNTQKPLSTGIEMPKEYVPQVPKTKGLDAFDPVHLDKSQNWAAVDRATANKPIKPSTARRSD
jgi:hypothetical protein